MGVDQPHCLPAALIQGATQSLTSVYMRSRIDIYMEADMAATLTSIRLDTKLADEAVRALGAKSRTEAVHMALKEVVRLNGFKGLMKENGGKLKFENFDK